MHCLVFTDPLYQAKRYVEFEPEDIAKIEEKTALLFLRGHHKVTVVTLHDGKQHTLQGSLAAQIQAAQQLELNRQLLLSVQGALVSEVTANLYAVTVGYKGSRIHIAAYFDGPVSDDDREMISCVAGEVQGDFLDPFRVEEVCYSLDETKLKMLDFWLFMRKECAGRQNDF